jgi:hypothetical protein
MTKQQVPPLRSPGFPVELGGVDALHAPFPYREAHTRPFPAQRGRKPGFAPVGMTLLFWVLGFGSRNRSVTRSWLDLAPHDSLLAFAEGQADGQKAAGKKGGQCALQPVVMEEGQKAVDSPAECEREPDDRAPHGSEIKIHFPAWQPR